MPETVQTTTKVVLVDLDDTLFDHQYCSRCGLAAVQRYQAPFATILFDELESAYLHLLDDVWPRVLRGEITIEASRIERFQRLSAHYGFALNDGEALTCSIQYREAYQLARRPMLGAAALLQQLKTKVTIGIVTNNMRLEQQEKLQYCGLDTLIDFLVVSEQVGVAKPNPIIFEEALRQAHSLPHEAVMVGDSWQNDVLGALDVGIRPIWFNHNSTVCPDSTLAVEINSFEPVERIMSLVLGQSC